VFGFFGDNVLTIIVKTPNSINQTLSMEACAGSKRTVWGGKGRVKLLKNQEVMEKVSKVSEVPKVQDSVLNTNSFLLNLHSKAALCQPV